MPLIQFQGTRGKVEKIEQIRVGKIDVYEENSLKRLQLGHELP